MPQSPAEQPCRGTDPTRDSPHGQVSELKRSGLAAIPRPAREEEAEEGGRKEGVSSVFSALTALPLLTPAAAAAPQPARGGPSRGERPGGAEPRPGRARPPRHPGAAPPAPAPSRIPARAALPPATGRRRRRPMLLRARPAAAAR